MHSCTKPINHILKPHLWNVGTCEFSLDTPFVLPGKAAWYYAENDKRQYEADMEAGRDTDGLQVWRGPSFFLVRRLTVECVSKFTDVLTWQCSVCLTPGIFLYGPLDESSSSSACS